MRPTLRPALTAVAVGNLLPLACVLLGLVDLPDVLVCFAVETVLLAWYAEGRWRDRLKLTWVFLLVTLILAARAIQRVTWDAGSVVGILGCVAASAGALVWAHRRGVAEPTGLGSLLWRTAVLLLGGVLALGWVDDLTAAGGPGGPVADVPLGALGRWLNEQVWALDADPVAVAAVAFVLIKAWNEVAHAAYRHVAANPVGRERAA